jgi:hypothetical protein
LIFHSLDFGFVLFLAYQLMAAGTSACQCTLLLMRGPAESVDEFTAKHFLLLQQSNS